MKPILFSTPMVQAILSGRKTQTRRVIKRFTDFGITDHCAYGKVGDILWVRETWQKVEHPELKYRYRADHLNPTSVTWKPSIFMPKDACRIFLEVTEIKVERLQDISEEDAIAEGVEVPTYKETELAKYKTNFSILWEFINGEESWESNPWVWAITFKND